MKRQTGTYITSNVAGDEVKAFVPEPLPPDPPLDLTAENILGLYEKANHAIGKLDAVASSFPDMDLFLYQYVRKEALLSSQIEGTQSSFSDLILYELDRVPGVPAQDTEEVSNYIAALNHGMKRIQEGFPLSLRLIREMHRILLQGVRGKNKQPGEFRTSQNWIGGSRPGTALFVPPPPNKLIDCLGSFETYIHEENNNYPVLIKAGLLHAQFETIHPFLDGNGRLGRLLIVLLLCHSRLLTRPVLYLSLYFKQHRHVYYSLLQQVRTTGDWEAWLKFFLSGVAESAEQAVHTANQITSLFKEDQNKISKLGRLSKSAQVVYTYLQEQTIIDIQNTSRDLNINRTTISNCFDQLIILGIIEEITGYRRNRQFVYKNYLNILSEGTEPL